MTTKKKPGVFSPGDLVTCKAHYLKGRTNELLRDKVATVIEPVAQDDKGQVFYRLKWGTSDLDQIAPNIGADALKHVGGDPNGRRRKEIGGEGDVLVEYDSNNSGGRWWLTDDHWEALEAAGWQVDWHTDPELRTSRAFGPDSTGRWLGALAGHARKRFKTMGEGIRDWENVTGLSSNSVGCSCCGPPHNFSSENTVTGEHNYWSTRSYAEGSSYEDD